MAIILYETAMIVMEEAPKIKAKRTNYAAIKETDAQRLS